MSHASLLVGKQGLKDVMNVRVDGENQKKKAALVSVTF